MRVLRQARGAPLLSMAVAEAAAAVVCEPGSRSTDRETLDAVLQVGSLARLGPCTFALCGELLPHLHWGRTGNAWTPQHRLHSVCLPDSPLQETAALGRPLFALFSHPAPRVAHAAALIMRAVAEGGAEAAQPMREAALTGEPVFGS